MRLKFTAATAVSAALIGTALTGGVAMAATPETAPTATARAACVHAEAQENVKIRKERKLSSTAVGLFTEGATTCILAKGTGQSYDLCKRKGTDWLKISYRGNTGWIPGACGSREV